MRRGTRLAAALLLVAGTPIVRAQSTPFPIGTNLATFRGGGEYASADAFKASQPWVSGITGVWDDGRALDLDERGWVRSLLPGQIARTWMMRPESRYPAGRYVVLYRGQGTLAYTGSATRVETAPGRDVLEVDPARGNLRLHITATDPADPVREIRVLLPGTQEGDLFHPTFLERLAGYRTLRFGQWMDTAGGRVIYSRWDERPRTDDARWTVKGVPLETIIALANRLQMDPWFCLPHRADDDFVRRFAELVRDTLDPRLVAHVEYSNEVHNTQFPQFAYARDQGLALGLSANSIDANRLFHARRSGEVMAICAEVLPRERLVRVFSPFTVTGNVADSLLADPAVRAQVDALGHAPYIPVGALRTADRDHLLGLTLDDLFAELDTIYLPRVLDRARVLAAVAARHGVPLVAYEGGQHLKAIGASQGDATINALFDAANRDARMGSLYDRYLQGWQDAGGRLFVHYESCHPYGNGAARFGALEYLSQPRAEAPKYDALMRWIEAARRAAIRALPVLMVIANRDFYYREYNDPRRELEAAGFTVRVAAGTLSACTPHANSGQGADGGIVNPDLALGTADAASFQALVIVGGWGASAYQYAFTGSYSDAAYNGTVEIRASMNRLIGDFVAQGKVVSALCHGVTVLAWARVNGVSPISGRSVCGYAGGSPASVIDGQSWANNVLPSRWHLETNGATMFASRSIGDATTATDDVYVDGRIVTAENYDSAQRFGQVLVAELAGR